MVDKLLLTDKWYNKSNKTHSNAKNVRRKQHGRDSMTYAIQTNLTAVFMLLVIFISMRHSKDGKGSDHRYFYAMLFLVAAILISDMLSEVFNNMEGAVAAVMLPLSTFFLFALSGFVVMGWYYYVLDLLRIDLKHPRVFNFMFSFPAFAMVVSAALSVFFDVLFIIDENNVYHRGPLFMIQVVILYGYVLSVLVLILKNRRRRSNRRDLFVLLAIPVLPIIGGVLQAVFYGVLLTWPLSAMSLLIVYVFIQSRLVSIDGLTQLFNRREFDRRIRSLNQQGSSLNNLACVVFDIDNFKTINDTHGHYIGDLVLQSLSVVFERSFEPYNGFIARVGGDEFTVMFEVDSDATLRQAIDDFQQNLDRFNQTKTFDFKLSLTNAAGIFDSNRHDSLEAFLRHLDMAMLEEKNSGKNAKRMAKART